MGITEGSGFSDLCLIVKPLHSTWRPSGRAGRPRLATSRESATPQEGESQRVVVKTPAASPLGPLNRVRAPRWLAVRANARQFTRDRDNGQISGTTAGTCAFAQTLGGRIRT